MYRKPKFLKLLHEIRQQMARECDYDVDRFTQALLDKSQIRTPVTEDKTAKSVSTPRRRGQKKMGREA